MPEIDGLAILTAIAKEVGCYDLEVSNYYYGIWGYFGQESHYVSFRWESNFLVETSAGKTRYFDMMSPTIIQDIKGWLKNVFWII